MKHEMPVMTEEKRQALIDHAKESILRQKDLMSRHDELLTNDLFQNGMMLVEIALASLAADRIGVVEVWPDNDRRCEFQLRKSMPVGDYDVYTALPVPVMQPVELPEKQWSDYGYYIFDADDVVKAIRAAGGEVKP